MRVLVTGTDGYIGVVLAPFLLARGYDIVGLDTGFYRDAWLYNNGIATLPSVKNKDLRRMTVDDVVGMDAVCILLNSPTTPWGSSVRILRTPSIIRAA
jgi:nucleoside-diphosphate-sugar epimerase